jgi:GNAT superfamily N-acetyltransferase
MAIAVREGQLADVWGLLNTIPEFGNIPGSEVIQNRISPVPHLVLTAYEGEIVIACKVGYERDGRFYSWLGAVLPAYRKSGVATVLADYQEEWVKARGYTSIWMKTRNCFPAMLLMAHRRGFRITQVIPRAELSQNRIILEKAL